MTAHLIHELEQLKRQLFAVVAMVEDNLSLAVKAVQERDAALARRTVDDDALIDRAEVAVEEECLKLLALHQPVAVDLRFIVAALKLNSDLERIGDLSVNIAERAIFLGQAAPVPVPFDFDAMASKVTAMLKRSLDALVNKDPDTAAEVCAADDEVDAIHRGMYQQVKNAIRQHPEHLDSLIHLLSVSRDLERIADHATNIAEDVIYLVKGFIVRHSHDASGKRKA